MAAFRLNAATLLPFAWFALCWALPAHATEPTAPHAAPNSTLRPYHAHYAIYRNGKLTGRMELTLLQRGERWVLRSAGSGTHGLARILAARDDQEVSGLVQEGRFRPELYTRHTRVAGIDDRWQVEFDWDARRVSIAHDKDDPLLLDMVEDSLDPLTLKLQMRQRLRHHDLPLHFQMVEEDEIDEQNFRLLPSEWMETSLGCLLTAPVEKIRHNSKRYTRAWHAPDLDFIEVRMEHGKTGGNHVELRITELAFDGVDVPPSPGCSALQSKAAQNPGQSGRDRH
jgi:hypothetical protein